MNLQKASFIVLGVVVTLMVASSFWIDTSSFHPPLSESKIGISPKNLKIGAGSDIIAYVNDAPIYEDEISDLYAQMPKAVALDNYITKVKAAIRDSEISDYYARNISDAMYTKYAVSYSLYADLNSAIKAVAILSDKSHAKYSEVFKLFKRFEGENKKEELFTTSQFPYDLGKVVEQLKLADFSQPLPTRSGYFILYLHEKAAGTKPEVKEVKAQIVKTIVQQRLSEKIISLRGKARIELK